MYTTPVYYTKFSTIYTIMYTLYVYIYIYIYNIYIVYIYSYTHQYNSIECHMLSIRVILYSYGGLEKGKLSHMKF